MAKTAADMVAEAKARVENLTVEQAAAEIEGGDALLIDIREPCRRRWKTHPPPPAENAPL